MRYAAVVFDMFGTLADEPTAQNVAARAAIANLVGAEAHDLERIWRDTSSERLLGAFVTPADYVSHMFRALGFDHHDGHVAKAVRVRLDWARSAAVPRPDAAPTLTALRAAGLQVGMLSNCTTEVVTVWDETAFPALVDDAVLSAGVGMKKPDLRIYTLACERLGVAPGDCLYVGDGGDWELAGAAGAGMDPVLIRVPHERPEDVTYKQEAMEWSGRTVGSLGEVLALAGVAI